MKSHQHPQAMLVMRVLTVASIEVTDHEVLNTVNNISWLQNVMGMSYCLNVLNVYVLIPLIIKTNHLNIKILNI